MTAKKQAAQKAKPTSDLRPKANPVKAPVATAPEAPAAPAPVQVGPRRVRATRLGYYDNKRRREGNVFTIQSSQEFSDAWMEYVDKRTPESITTGQQQIDEARAEILGERFEAKRGATGGENPLGAD